MFNVNCWILAARGKSNFTSVFISLNVCFLKTTEWHVRNGQGHYLSYFCFLFIFFYLPMTSRRSGFPFFCFSPHPPLPFFLRGLYARVCWRSLKQRGRKGRLTKEHFISVKFFVRYEGVSGLNPPLLGYQWGWSITWYFPLRKGESLLEGGKMPLPCVCSRHLFFIPSSQGAS